MKIDYKMSDSPALLEQAAENFQAAHSGLSHRVDRLMRWLLAAEWPALVLTALILDPFRWEGRQSHLNPHFCAALLAGPLFICPAILLSYRFPIGLSRHVLAVAQILVSVLLIDVTNGRIESHFHIFGSLAILAFYRDWRILVTASVVTAADHFVRGFWFPESVYGILTASPWRWIEHAFWVAFEDLFLIINGATSIREMRLVAMREAQLSWGAYYDVLTGLPNRRALLERFDSAIAKSRGAAHAVLFIDLDHFKQANDTLGHGIGDKLLQQVTGRLGSVLNPGATLARIGGDEFIAFLETDASPSLPLEQADRLLSVLCEPFDVEGHRLLLSASIGIALYPEHGTELGALQELADRAMYVAKGHGRNQAVVFSEAVETREEFLRDVSHDLSHAHSRGEMQLHFQPLIHRSGTLTGFEALLRWIHPVHGMIQPMDFIPLAEKSGYMDTLGEWVLQEACRECAVWNEHGLGLGVAVNISAVQFESGNFATRVLDALRRSKVDPSLLTLELTESLLIRERVAVGQELAKLRLHGVRIALDDFGTGYSSLSYLSTIPADIIKLDRSFLERETQVSTEVIQSIIELSHRIGLRVIGEGVESPRQSDYLSGMGCDEMQGFYFGRPIPSNEVGAYMAENSFAPAGLVDA